MVRRDKEGTLMYTYVCVCILIVKKIQSQGGGPLRQVFLRDHRKEKLLFSMYDAP